MGKMGKIVAKVKKGCLIVLSNICFYKIKCPIEHWPDGDSSGKIRSTDILGILGITKNVLIIPAYKRIFYIYGEIYSE